MKSQEIQERIKRFISWIFGSLSSAVDCKRPITRYLSSEHKFLYNKNIKEGMEENKMSKQIVPLEVGHSSKKKRNLLRLY